MSFDQTSAIWNQLYLKQFMEETMDQETPVLGRGWKQLEGR